MSTWTTVLAGCAIAYLLKLAGYLVPARHLRGPRTTRVMSLLPVALLSALVATQAFSSPTNTPTLDSRAVAVAVALVALTCRAPFLLVVVLGAVTAAALRAFGWT